MTIFPDLERQLIRTAAAQGPRDATAPVRRGRRPRPRVAVALAASLLALTGTAVAANEIWEPFSDPGDNPPELAPGPAPETQTGLLAVLRRAPRAADRGSDVRATVRRIDGRLNHGIFPDTVRKVGETEDGQAIVLFASRRFADDGDDGRAYTIRDALCLAYPLGKFGMANPCWKPATITSNHANTQASAPNAPLHMIGLVPDGVAKVTLTARDGRRVTQKVTNNYYDFADQLNANPANNLLNGATITWQAADGSTRRAEIGTDGRSGSFVRSYAKRRPAPF